MPLFLWLNEIIKKTKNRGQEKGKLFGLIAVVFPGKKNNVKGDAKIYYC